MGDRVTGKVALITGAARGQGRAFAVRLAEEGADVIAIDICEPIDGVPYPGASSTDLQETVAQIEGLGRRVVAAEVDVRDQKQLNDFVESAVAELGGLDVIVANAAIAIPAKWSDVTASNLETTLDINVRGVWNTVMSGAQHLIERGAGSIILISSSAALTVQPLLLPYVTSKFAVRGMAKAFAMEFAEHKIRVNSVHPGGVNTDMAGPDVFAIVTPELERNPAYQPTFAHMLPVELLEPEDIANTVLFLASDESRWYTAQELVPDAGMSEI